MAKGWGISRENLFTTISVLIVLFSMIIIDIILIADNPPAYSEWRLNQLSKKNRVVYPREVNHDQFPLILLYQGQYPDENTRWDTATWAGWGEYEGNLQDKIIEQDLIWAAEGAKLIKTCDVPCYVTRNQSLIPKADAIVMEIISHQKTFQGGKKAIPWPARFTDQLWTMFYFEPQGWYASLVEDELILDRFDIIMSPKQTSTLPITLICNWGKERKDYLNAPPVKINTPNFICDFSQVFDPNFSRDLKDFKRHVGVDSFYGDFKNMEAPSPFNLSQRLEHVGKYKFVLITEGAFERDWVSPEWSQAFLAGTVPVYLGAPNMEEFAPGPNSFISFEKFGNAQSLAEYLKRLNDNDEEYMKFFDWKNDGLSESFERHLDNCAHLGECRLCKEVIARRDQREGY